MSAVARTLTNHLPDVVHIPMLRHANGIPQYVLAPPVLPPCPGNSLMWTGQTWSRCAHPRSSPSSTTSTLLKLYVPLPLFSLSPVRLTQSILYLRIMLLNLQQKQGPHKPGGHHRDYPCAARHWPAPRLGHRPRIPAQPRGVRARVPARLHAQPARGCVWIRRLGCGTRPPHAVDWARRVHNVRTYITAWTHLVLIRTGTERQDALLQRRRRERGVLRVPRRRARLHWSGAHRRALDLRDDRAPVRHGLLHEPHRVRAWGACVTVRPRRMPGRLLARGRRDVRVREARTVLCEGPLSYLEPRGQNG